MAAVTVPIDVALEDQEEALVVLHRFLLGEAFIFEYCRRNKIGEATKRLSTWGSKVK